MIFVQYDKTATTTTRITLIHYQPDSLSQDLLNTGILVNEIPTPDTSLSGKFSILVIDPITKILSYDYVDIPLTLEQQVETLKSQNAQIILSLVKGGLM